MTKYGTHGASTVRSRDPVTYVLCRRGDLVEVTHIDPSDGDGFGVDLPAGILALADPGCDPDALEAINIEASVARRVISTTTKEGSILSEVIVFHHSSFPLLASVGRRSSSSLS